MRKVTLLRLDHRTFRDQRITTHVALSARALGCAGFLYSGEKDENMEQSVRDVLLRWGGAYSVQYLEPVKSYIKNWKGPVVHLTMYGEPHTKTISSLEKVGDKPLLLIVGGAKVPNYIYSLADFNTAIGWQPHSEVAATTLFLYDLFGKDNSLYHSYNDAIQKIDGQSPKAKRSSRYEDY